LNIKNYVRISVGIVILDFRVYAGAKNLGFFLELYAPPGGTWTATKWHIRTFKCSDFYSVIHVRWSLSGDFVHNTE